MDAKPDQNPTTLASPAEPHFDGCARESLKPLLWSMQLSGMFFSTHLDTQIENQNQSNPPRQNPDTVFRKRSDIGVRESCPISTVSSSSSGSSPNRLSDLLVVSDIYEEGEKERERVTKQCHNLKPELNQYNTDTAQCHGQDLCRNLQSPNQNVKKQNPCKTTTTTTTTTTVRQGSKETMRKSPSLFRRIFNGRLYAGMIVLVLWGNIARCVIYIGDDRVVPMTASGLIIWFLMCALNGTALFASCYNREHFNTFFRCWKALYSDPTTRHLGLLGVSSNGYLKYVIGVQWMTVMFNIASAIFLMVKEDEFSGGMNVVMYLNGYKSVLTIFLWCVMSFFCSSATVAPVGLVVVVCKHIVDHFTQLRNVMNVHIKAAGDGFPPLLKELREHHLSLCQLIAIMDRYMKVALAIIYCISTLTVCFILHRLIGGHDDLPVMVIGLFWISIAVFSIVILTYSASNVHIATSAMLSQLMTIRTTGITPDQQAQLQLFLAQLIGPDEGFSVLGLMVIRRELMLTLLGLFITYAVVLVQFSQ